MYESRVCWRSSRQHNQNEVLVSSSRRADDVPGITRERRRECLYVTIGPLCLRVTYYTQTLVTKNPLSRDSYNTLLCSSLRIKRFYKKKLNIPIRICITVIPPSRPPAIPPHLPLMTQQIHCPFQPKQSPSCVKI